jgi:hypothetical protein
MPENECPIHSGDGQTTGDNYDLERGCTCGKPSEKECTCAVAQKTWEVVRESLREASNAYWEAWDTYSVARKACPVHRKPTRRD